MTDLTNGMADAQQAEFTDEAVATAAERALVHHPRALRAAADLVEEPA